MRWKLVRKLSWTGFICVLAITALPRQASGQQKRTGGTCDDLANMPGIFWQGTKRTMTLAEIAAYAAPVYWLSPDEPTMHRRARRDLRVPAALPFETQPESPVVYYQLDELNGTPEADGVPYVRNDKDKGASTIDLRNTSTIRLKYFTYFPSEEGVGQHQHDVEPTEFRILIGRSNGAIARQYGYNCDNEFYLMRIMRVTGEAHGNRWYYNVLDVDQSTVLPIHLLIEEGKHASATDKNADGYFTPGYDVSVRPNDAWGVRDTIRGGTLFTGQFESWMAKIRRPEHRALPPLPADSRLMAPLIGKVDRIDEHATYELRPLPSSTLATSDAALAKKIAEKEVENWPVVHERVSLSAPLSDWFNEGRQLRPFSFAAMYDGEMGLSVAVPLLLVKTVHEPLTGGYLVHRFTFKDNNFRDLSWMLLYTPSASRWFDKYVAVGFETNRNADPDGDGVTQTDRDFALELGVKFRFRMETRVIGVPNFWGFRMGVKNIGAVDIRNMKYVFEFGAGVW
jgi:hypothetical protein